MYAITGKEPGTTGRVPLAIGLADGATENEAQAGILVAFALSAELVARTLAIVWG
jgi:hypothetical protein